MGKFFKISKTYGNKNTNFTSLFDILFNAPFKKEHKCISSNIFPSEKTRLFSGLSVIHWLLSLADCGDHVVVINSQDIALRGDEWVKRVYFHHTGYHGGATWTLAWELHKKDPTLVRKSKKLFITVNVSSAKFWSKNFFNIRNIDRLQSGLSLATKESKQTSHDAAIAHFWKRWNSWGHTQKY